jgi:hypothetical protein
MYTGTGWSDINKYTDHMSEYFNVHGEAGVEAMRALFNRITCITDKLWSHTNRQGNVTTRVNGISLNRRTQIRS